MKRIREFVMVACMLVILILASMFIAIVNTITDVYLFIFDEEKYNSKYGLDERKKEKFIISLKTFITVKFKDIKGKIKEFKRSWIKLG